MKRRSSRIPSLEDALSLQELQYMQARSAKDQDAYEMLQERGVDALARVDVRSVSACLELLQRDISSRFGTVCSVGTLHDGDSGLQVIAAVQGELQDQVRRAFPLVRVVELTKEWYVSAGGRIDRQAA